MVPAGAATEEAVRSLSELLGQGDVVIDGGNSFYKDDVRRSQLLAPRGVSLVDAGTSGGVFGLERGYCLMIGGAPAAVARLAPIFQTLAPGRGAAPPTPGRTRTGPAEEGWLHCGPSGAGHFVKMIDNGIEYGMMQAYAEGLDILRGAGAADWPEGLRYPLDLAEITELWRRGSVVSSWLLDLTAGAMARDPELAGFSGAVADSGEGRWTVEAAVEEAVPAPVLTTALFARFRSRVEATFGDKVLSAMRRAFGGHAEAARGEGP
ncbi:MAG: decarboxylating 6-phosphogluconate dehydrogenase [Anaeromyxobacter sp.]